MRQSIIRIVGPGVAPWLSIIEYRQFVRQSAAAKFIRPASIQYARSIHTADGRPAHFHIGVAAMQSQALPVNVEPLPDMCLAVEAVPSADPVAPDAWSAVRRLRPPIRPSRIMPRLAGRLTSTRPL